MNDRGLKYIIAQTVWDNNPKTVTAKIHDCVGVRTLGHVFIGRKSTQKEIFDTIEIFIGHPMPFSRENATVATGKDGRVRICANGREYFTLEENDEEYMGVV
jgi:hypothetical protein